jgi:hypothetical protein
MAVRRWLMSLLAAALPVTVALAALPLRAVVHSADVATVLVGVAALAGTLGVAATPLLAATSAAASFALLWAEPYGSLQVRQPSDRLASLFVLVVGAVLGLLCRRRQRGTAPARPRGSAHGVGQRDQRASMHLQTVGRVAGEIAEGDMAGLVVLDVARSLVELLGLRDCRFEVAPLPSGSKPCLAHTGEFELHGVRWSPAQIGLPAGGFYIPLIARGRIEGRYVCVPRARSRLSDETMTVAVTLADQAASALLLDPVA